MIAFLRRLSAAAALLTLALTVPAAAADGPGRATLTVLATTDLHMHLKDYDYYADRPDMTVGLVRTAGLIAAARAASPNTLLLDAGDLLEGNPMADHLARERRLPPGTPHPAMAMMNSLGYDAAVIGNHEFNYGLDFLTQTIAAAKFPYLAGNVYKAGADHERPWPAYVILERELTDEAGAKRPVRIGVIGLLTPQIVVWDRDKLAGKLVTEDIVDTARRLVPEVRKAGADVVIALIHSGLSGAPRQGGDENAAAYVTTIDGVDAVISGHSHRVFPGEDYAGLAGADIRRGTLNGKPTVMAGYHRSHLGVIELALEQADGRWRVAGGHAEARPISARNDGKLTALAEPVPELVEMIRDEHERTLAYTHRAVGRTTRPLNTFFALIGDTAVTKLVADAQRQFVAAAVAGTPLATLPLLSAASPFKAGGKYGFDYFTDIPAGGVALRNVADLYLYPNTVAAVRVTGSELREWLEASARVFNQLDPRRAAPQSLVDERVPSYNFDIIDGVTYRIDLSQPARYDRDGRLVAPEGRRIRDLRYQGQPVADDQEFLVATNNCRAGGGGAFPALDGSRTVWSAPETTQQVIADYIRAHGVIEPEPTRNWGFLPMALPGRVLFATSPRAEAAAVAHKGLQPAGPGQNGLVLYAVDMRQEQP